MNICKIFTMSKGERLFVAARNDKVEEVMTLLVNGADMEWKDEVNDL